MCVCACPQCVFWLIELLAMGQKLLRVWEHRLELCWVRTWSRGLLALVPEALEELWSKRR